MKICPSCHCTYTLAQWRRLPLAGWQEVPAMDGEPAYWLEHRDCRCGFTIAVEHPVCSDCGEPDNDHAHDCPLVAKARYEDAMERRADAERDR